MAAPPDLQDEPLSLPSPGSQWFGGRGEGEDEAAAPKGARPAQQDGEPAWGSGAGAGVVSPRELCSGPARSPPVAMETASTGKFSGHRDPANGDQDSSSCRSPIHSSLRLPGLFAWGTNPCRVSPGATVNVSRLAENSSVLPVARRKKAVGLVISLLLLFQS